MTNILTSIINIVQSSHLRLDSRPYSLTRANSMGDSLESYIKDSFCNSFNSDQKKKNILYSENFSYLGNQNNPPDIIIKEGDAIEVKKIESLSSAIALNSSYPKNKLKSDDSRITKACKECELKPWIEKDIFYFIGFVKEKKLKLLWIIQGECYAADKEVYERVASNITKGVGEIPNIEFQPTNEIAKIKKVDPLGITDLRVRGMWHIANPIKVFSEYININLDNEITIVSVILDKKYNSFPKESTEKLESLTTDGSLVINSASIKSPDNPAKMLNVKIIKYEI
jgi:hypothetical protein